jgi:hypothetical protein
LKFPAGLVVVAGVFVVVAAGFFSFSTAEGVAAAAAGGRFAFSLVITGSLKS